MKKGENMELILFIGNYVFVSRVTAEWISCICCVCVRITQLNLRLSCISLYRPARLTDSIFSHQCSRFLVVAQLHKVLPHNPRLKGRLSSYSFHAIVFQSKKLLTDENSYRVMWTNRGVNGWNSSTYQARLEESFLFFSFFFLPSLFYLFSHPLWKRKKIHFVCVGVAEVANRCQHWRKTDHRGRRMDSNSQGRHERRCCFFSEPILRLWLFTLQPDAHSLLSPHSWCQPAEHHVL